MGKPNTRQAALQSAVIYSLVVAVWLLASDPLLDALAGELQEWNGWPLLKRLMAATGAVGLLFLLARPKRIGTEETPTEREQQLEAIVQAVDDVLFTLDREGRHTGVYGRWLERFQMDPAAFLGKTAREVLGPEAGAVHEAANARALTGENVMYEWSYPGPDGRPGCIQTSLSPLRNAAGEVIGVVGVGRDTTLQKQAETALRETNALLRAVIQASPLAIVSLDREGRVITWNPAAERTFGWREDEVLGKPYPAVPPEDLPTHQLIRERTEQGEPLASVQTRRLTRDGRLIDVSISTAPLRDAEGRITGTVGVIEDITARKRQEEQIRYLAMHDPLTDLPNRRALEERLEQVVAKAKRGQHSSVMLMDLDDFKLVNDTLGHPAGDRLLIELAYRCPAAVRQTDMVARLGGDEFAVLLEDTSLEVAHEVAERLRRAVAEFQFTAENHAFVLGASIGLTLVDGSLPPQSVLGLADAAMYAAKEAGKNRIVVYRPGEQKALSLGQSSQWAIRIREAIQAGRFQLYCQPVVQVATGQPEFYEVLLRLREPDGSIILPDEFLPAADRFGLLSQLDRQVLDQALDLLAAHPELRLSVNLGGGSGLLDDALLHHVESQVQAAGTAASRLTLEVRESTALGDLMRVQRWMYKLKALGCRFALDNFGTGSSSLAYLRVLPTDYVKIDRSIVHGLDASSTNQAVIQATAALARALGKEVVAEGVETEAVARLVSDLGIPYGQGFWWARPAPLDPDTIGSMKTPHR